MSENVEIEIAKMGERLDGIGRTLARIEERFEKKETEYTSTQTGCNTRFNEIEKNQAVQGVKIGFFSTLIATAISVLATLFGGKM